MKVLNRYLILFAILIGASVLGAVFSYAAITALDEGRTIPWTILETPPEKAKKVIAPYHVETGTGKKLYYASFPCVNNCWQEVAQVENQPEYLLPVSDCGWYPDTTKYIDALAICERWGQGYYKKVWAIDKQGNVWLWEKGMGEGGAIMIYLSPYVGFLIVFSQGCFILLLFIILKRISAHSFTSRSK